MNGGCPFARRILVAALLVAAALPAAAQPVRMDAPGLVLRGIPFTVTVNADEAAGLESPGLTVGGREVPLRRTETGTWEARNIEAASTGTLRIEVRSAGSVVASKESRSIPAWLAILPPLLAIGMALAFKRVVPALFIGIWVGAFTAADFSFYGLWRGLLDTFEVYVLGALTNPDHAAIVLFSLMIGGMVGIIQKNGGTQGIVNIIVRWARDPQRGQVSAGILGVAIFFDDYANTLVVGNTMRPVTDRLRISREKLAYIVDSTAAPVSCIALVTTWIGYEVGLIGDSVASIDGFDASAYGIFLSSIPYSFYPILAIFFVFMVALSQRDFGPMLRAEVRARTTGRVLGAGARVDEAAVEGRELLPRDDRPHRAMNAVIPIVVLVGSVLASLYVTGIDSLRSGGAAEPFALRDIIGGANSYKSLMWGSLLGVLAAAALSIGGRILSIDEVVESWYAGLKGMLFAMIILILAWALSAITDVLHTADFLTSAIGGSLHPGVVPTLVFFLAAATAFATGSSWGTMGILMPLVLPLAWAVLDADGFHSPEEHFHIISSTVSAVLAGAVWGDHCSPISDTTILSSMASGCDHIEHVRTQLPYAVTVGAVAVLLGTLPTGFGFPWWISIVLGSLVLVAFLYRFGTRVPDMPDDGPVPEAAPGGTA
jgi:Na+/H+ antiporter NhaC